MGRQRSVTAMGRLASLAWRPIVFAAMCAALAGCVYDGRTPPPPAVTAPLQDGDIVITFSGTALNWVCALGSADPQEADGPPYSHAEMVLREGNGPPLLGGISGGALRSRDLDDGLTGLERFAVYRARLPAAERSRPADVLRRWIRDPRISEAAFDYTMQDVPGRRDRFYCIGLLNEIHREAGMAPPFPRTNRPHTPLGDHFSAAVGARPEDIVAASSIQQNPLYERVAAWESPEAFSDQALAEEVAGRAVLAYYDQGWRLIPSSRPNLVLLAASVFSRPPEHADKAAAAAAALNLFGRDTRMAWDRMVRRGMGSGLSREEKRRVLEKVCLSFR
ncbi:MAG TPA: hypothetical protein P5137_15600, partial [Candidatus Brocadiia bacterium]|nr:hypothetical protein [Candidatus Brocadiia bacterium]